MNGGFGAIESGSKYQLSGGKQRFDRSSSDVMEQWEASQQAEGNRSSRSAAGEGRDRSAAGEGRECPLS
eukprot:jgi/Psemu1/62407/gm1.62407_g